MDREIKVSAIYKHFKGHVYRVLAIAYNAENYQEEKPKDSQVVVYQNTIEPYDCWVRPYDMFNSLVDRNKYPEIDQKYRFEEMR